jgi:pimeloyl-ACP methyl ester carboxylesterase
MINWYRACMRLPLDVDHNARVRVPTLVIWGARDHFIHRKMARASVEFCDQGRLERFDDATHWLHHEEPERVSALLTGFFEDVTPRG